MSRQPIFNVPAVVIGLVAVLALAHAARLALPDDRDARLLAATAFVPGRVTMTFAPHRVANALATLAKVDAAPDGAAAAGLFFLGEGTSQPWTVVTYALLHADWTHLGLNVMWLLAFGVPVARRLGSGRFLVFCALGSVAGAAAHWLTDPVSLQPLIGASAAVSACMGAATRFAFQTDPARRFQPPALAPRLSLTGVLADRRALGFVLVWAVATIVTGVLAVPLGLSAFPIAWQAHFGGFVFGLLALPMFDRQAAMGGPPDAAAVPEGGADTRPS